MLTNYSFTIQAAWLFLIIGLSSCAQSSNTEMEEVIQEIKSTKMVMTAAQLELADIQFGRPEWKAMPQTVECRGMVEVPPSHLASIYSPTEGFVEKVPFIVGDFVKKGTIITSIRNHALLEKQSALLEAKAQLAFLEQDFQRKTKLDSVNATSGVQVEQAEAAYRSMLNHYKGLKAVLKALGVNVDQLENNGKIQTHIPIYAPISGYVSKVGINLGKSITPQNLLYELVDVSHPHLELQLFAVDMSKVKVGQSIYVTIPGDSTIFEANVFRIAQQIDSETNTALVHGHFRKEPVPILPGTYLNSYIEVSSDSLLMVPQSAILRKGPITQIVVEKEPHSFELFDVELGPSWKGWVAIASPRVDFNERIVTKGAYYFQGGEE